MSLRSAALSFLGGITGKEVCDERGERKGKSGCFSGQKFKKACRFTGKQKRGYMDFD
ncbi:hypothetical protein CHCC15091_1988 [Bacillus licheniformis]|nr:hypothetical protein B4089_2117 [Bacillus licheniformis]OLF96887.1 hypothetical protein B4089_0488 [Bacillus licheniformis]TWK09663.1 hypothetical protein CHCC20442_4450 [Bacillus licheniformis]TWL26460.1 hypothetical protein CHCC16874_2850 [Bacillus licheniformis]TWM14947.1 hypothetical protein CHCC15091_1988 [Bacillus licheniformis]